MTAIDVTGLVAVAWLIVLTGGVGAIWALLCCRLLMLALTPTRPRSVRRRTRRRRRVPHRR